MRRHKIIAQIILLILSVINFALPAPVSVRGITEDVTTASRKCWDPSYERWTNSADRTNTPSSLVSSESEHRLEHWQELKPHDPRSPMDPYYPLRQSRLGSTGWNDPLPAGSPPSAHSNLPLNIGLNAAPQPIQEPTDHQTGSDVSSDISPSAWLNLPESPSLLYSHDSNPLPPQDIDLNLPPSSQGPTGDQPPPALPPDPGSSKRPASLLDPGPSKRPYNPSGPGPSSWASGPEPSTWTLGPEPSTLGPKPSAWTLGPSDPGSSKRPASPLDPRPSKRPYNPSGPGPSTWTLGPEPSAWTLGPESSTWASSLSDPGSSTRPYRPSNPGPSILGNSDPGPAPHPPSSPSSPGPVQHESEMYFSELFKGRFKRHIFGSHYVNAAEGAAGTPGL